MAWAETFLTFREACRFDSTFGKTDRKRFEKEIEGSGLVVIGETLNAAEIQQAMERGQ